MAEDVDKSARRGRPQHKEPYRSTTVVLFDRQLDFLDRYALSLQKKSRAHFNRTEILRALVDALQQSGLDLTGAQTEEDLARLIRERLIATGSRRGRPSTS